MKRLTISSVGRDVGEQKFHILQVGMQKGTIILNQSLAVSLS